MGKLQDKVAIVTGSSRGIGLGVARALSAEGARVVVSSRTEADGIPVAKELGSDEGRAIFVQCDVSDLSSLKNLIHVTIETFGKIDILVNNAGVVNSSSIDNMTEKEFDFTITTNLKSDMFASQYALPYLRETKGTIINMSSFGFLTGSLNTIVYNTSKGAIAGFTKSLAAEVAPDGVRANSIAPGVILTDANKTWIDSQGDYDEVVAMLEGSIPLGRLGTIDDIGEAALFLATCEYISGSMVVVDGGIAKY